MTQKETMNQLLKVYFHILNNKKLGFGVHSFGLSQLSLHINIKEKKTYLN